MYHRNVILLFVLVMLGFTGACRESSLPPSPVPNELIGVWLMITERGNAFSCEFLSDSTYQYNAIMPDGSLRYTLQEWGRITVSGTQLTFSPENSIMTRTDPHDPVQPSTQSTPQRPLRTLTWAVSGDTLTLTGPDGTSTFTRE